MASVGEINRVGRRIKDSLYDLRRRRDSFSREVNSLQSWWQGEGSRVFQDEFHEINLEINRIFSMMDNLEDRINRLAMEVQYAEEERRRKAQELRMAQLQKSGNMY